MQLLGSNVDLPQNRIKNVNGTKRLFTSQLSPKKHCVSLGDA